MTYDQNFGPAGLKTGVGLTLDLGASHDVAAVDLVLVGAPTGVSLYVTDEAPTSVPGLPPAATVDAKTRPADHPRPSRPRDGSSPSG